MNRAFKAELLKLKGSRMLAWSGVVVVGYAVLTVVLNVALLRDPGFTSRLAQVGGPFGRAVDQGFYVLNWKNQLRVAVQGISGTWGLLLLSFVTAYVFGREYKERTSKNLLTTPIRREHVVLAKLIVVFLWSFAIMILAIMVNTIGLAMMNTPDFAWTHLWSAALDAVKVTALLSLTLPLVAWLTILGRGYLRAMLFAFAVQMAGNGLSGTSASPYWPWNMPVHLVGASWLPVVSGGLPAASWAIALGVCALGTVLALRQFDTADDPS